MQATASSDKNGVTVTAFEVDQGALIKPAYGYRIDYEGRSVILSGDTRYSENLEKHAQGATLVVHEVAIANPEYFDKTPIVKYIMAHHVGHPDTAGHATTRNHCIGPMPWAYLAYCPGLSRTRYDTPRRATP